MVKIKGVEEGSIAQRLGVLPGDTLCSLNGHTVRDGIDLAFWEAEEEFILEIGRDGTKESYTGRKLAEQKLGIDLGALEFRRCNNRCIFCFYDQMPRGLRKSLYEKDDDFRLSFLYGNYITLTNVGDEDYIRIEEQRLTPLYISVHATDPAVRGKLLGTTSEDADIRPHLRRLANAAIEMHTQIVVCPGINDGEVLAETVETLATYYPSVRSVAIIPVGLTKHRKGLFPLREVKQGECLDIIQRVLLWQEEFRKLFGIGFVYPGDELLIKGEFVIPMQEFYDGFPQLENGIGNSRIFLDAVEELDTEAIRELKGHVVLLTAALPYPWLQLLRKRLVRETPLSCEVLKVDNSLFGDCVAVSGLLAGRDVRSAIQTYDRSVDLFVLPDNCLNDDNEFVDGITLDEVEASTGKRVLATSVDPAGLAEILSRELSG